MRPARQTPFVPLMAKRYTRRQLRHSDEFVSFWQRVYELLRQSAQPVLIGLGVAVFFSVTSLVYLRYRGQGQAQASRELTRAMKMYEAELLVPGKTEPQKGPSDDEEIQRFATAEARREAVLTVLSSILASRKNAAV